MHLYRACMKVFYYLAKGIDPLVGPVWCRVFGISSRHSLSPAVADKHGFVK